MTPQEAEQFLGEVFAMWVEPDRAARRASIEAHFMPDIRFADPDGEFVGYAGLEAFSDSLQTRFPGARFELTSPPDFLGGAIRGFWRFGPPDADGGVTGMDFAILGAGRKIQSLYAFVHLPGA